MRRFLVIGTLLLLIVPASGLTRQESVLEFVDSTRVSDSGFANTPVDEISLQATFHALEVKALLFDEVNNTLDILYYLQSLQNESGGFAPDERSEPDLEATITAIKTLAYLPVNQTQYISWGIYPFFNATIVPLLFTSTNGTFEIKELNSDRLRLWSEYFIISSRLSFVPAFPLLTLLDEVKALQDQNGIYDSIDLAIGSINLLHMLGDVPNDVDLASKFVLRFLVDNEAFSTDNDIADLETTYQAVIALSKIINLYAIEERDDIIRYVFDLQEARSGFRSDTGGVSLLSTHRAISILYLLGELDELLAPDVLQEVGFVNFPMLALLLLPVVGMMRRRYHD